jgi:hypothetical protein
MRRRVLCGLVSVGWLVGSAGIFSAQMQGGGLSASGWRIIAPHIQVGFEQVGPNTCTWRFRNGDDARTLESMEFSYTYSTSVLGTGRSSGPGTQTGDDTMPVPLGPQEVFGGPNTYRIAANCTSVNMRVTSAKWL